MNPPPETPLNVPIGPHRRVLWVRCRLDDLKEIKNALGGTVNDVFLAVVAGRARPLAAPPRRAHRGARAARLVPVSIRADEQRGALGNRITAMLGPLPVYASDPVERLRIVREAMKGLKESKQAVGAETLDAAAGLRAADDPRAGVAAQLLDPRLQPAGHERAGAAVPALPARARDAGARAGRRSWRREHALAIAIMSYNGNVDIGLMGDYDAMADLEEFGQMLEDSLAELLKAARKRSKARRRQRGQEESRPGAPRDRVPKPPSVHLTAGQRASR